MTDTNDPDNVRNNFIRHIVDEDIRGGRLPSSVRTRFPPEPNGYLHIGHAKSICLNFGLALDYGGTCNLRFDDTNPEKETDEYARSIEEAIRWLGYDWHANGIENRFFASDYYAEFYEYAEALIRNSFAYVDSQSPGEIQLNRGTAHSVGVESPYRNRSVEENLVLFRGMRAGSYAEGAHVLRAKIDMSSPNFNLRDPILYRIRFTEHYRTGRDWCIYPMYDYAHCVSDAIEKITHSLATLEFEDHRPLYDWVLSRLAEIGILERPLPRQFEFSRLNMTFTVTSKRKLQQLVNEGHVEGWDDPRMPTLIGLRRRGFTPESIRLVCARTAVTKVNSWIDWHVLESALREDLEDRAPRAIAVVDPVKLIIENFPEAGVDDSYAPVHPHHDERGVRRFKLTRELWIERDDFRKVPQKGFYRLFPGNKVRLKYGYVVECTSADFDSAGHLLAVRCRYFADSRSGTEGAATYKVKGTIHWLSAEDADAAEVRTFGHLFLDPQPDFSSAPLSELLNSSSRTVSRAYVESAAMSFTSEQHLQFERHGYFVVDSIDSRPGRPVFNRITGLRNDPNMHR